MKRTQFLIQFGDAWTAQPRKLHDWFDVERAISATTENVQARNGNTIYTSRDLRLSKRFTFMDLDLSLRFGDSIPRSSSSVLDLFFSCRTHHFDTPAGRVLAGPTSWVCLQVGTWLRGSDLIWRSHPGGHYSDWSRCLSKLPPLGAGGHRWVAAGDRRRGLWKLQLFVGDERPRVCEEDRLGCV